MGRLPIVVTVSVLVGFTLACGGISKGAGKDSLGEAAAILATVENSPEKTRVRAMLEEAYIQVHRGDLGLFAVSGFKVELEDACEDGRINLGELVELEAEATWMATPARIAPDGRAALLAGLDQGGSTAPVGRAGALSSWTLDDLERRAKAAGWATSYCEHFDDAGYSESSCTLQNGHQYGSVSLVRHPDAESARWDMEDSAAAWRVGAHVLTVKGRVN